MGSAPACFRYIFYYEGPACLMGDSGQELFRRSTAKTGLMLAALALLVSACAGKLPEVEPGAVPDIAKEAPETSESVSDPWEGMNRSIFWFNLQVDRFLLRPAAIGYRFALPNPVQKSVHNLLENASSPVTFANDLLQGEFKRSGVTLGRLVTNSTVGVGGLFDVADRFGWERHKSDFGQTMALWGAGDGPYMMIPLLGPANVRDGFGRAVDVFLDPLTYVYFFHDVEYVGPAQRALSAIDYRARNLEQIDELQASSVDYYAVVRSAYQQARRKHIFGEEVIDQNFDDGAFDDME